MKIVLGLIVMLAIILPVDGQQLKSPSEFLGYPLGSYFSRHHQVHDYFKELEKAAEKNVKLQEYGKTEENRSLFLVYISSEENISNLESIRKSHADLNGKETVAVVWLSYNVHGNESSGTEAAMQTAYDLITKRSDLLKNTVVILDPCINPDGRDRYVNWYNQQKNKKPNSDLGTVEHQEPWPGGRPNHYLFDLNRDWAWLTQKETQQRISVYNQWLPHVHVDFHEQGINNPYYFAPAAEPFHEVITDWQRDFQSQVGKNNAKYFDKEGWFYFTKEIFDLLYPSYGDTYPTYNGAIGMTYEQGGSTQGGLSVINREGAELKLKDRIEHHNTSGIATVEACSQHYKMLIDEFKKFCEIKQFNYNSYVIGGNSEKIRLLTQLLDAHQIEYSYGNGQQVKGFDFNKNGNGTITATSNHLIVSTDQKKGTLVNVLFEPKTKLSDSLTYDITAWSLPYAYGVEALASKTLVKGTKRAPEKINNSILEGAYAYIVEWNSMIDAQFLADLLQQGIKVRYAEFKFTLKDKKFNPGTLIIARGDNSVDYASTLMAIANKYQIVLTPTMSGMVDSGKDFGSSSVKLVKTPRVALLTGDGMSSLNVGEVWHFFEEKLNYPISLIDVNIISANQLDKYTALIVPEGWASVLYDSETHETIREWVAKGGKLLALGSAVGYFTDQNGYALKTKSSEPKEENEASRHEHAHIAYDKIEREELKKIITGAIFKCKVEQSNPLAFGYDSDYFTLKLSADAYEWLENGGNVMYLDDKAELVAGFAGMEAIKNQPNTLVLGQYEIGQGKVVYMVDNPLFRGFWTAGHLMFVNAIFLNN